MASVQPGTSVEDAAKLLHTHHIGCVPVLEDDRLVGILTETGPAARVRGIVRLAHAVESAGSNDARTGRAGELARVVRLIGIEKIINIAGWSHPDHLRAHGDEHRRYEDIPVDALVREEAFGLAIRFISAVLAAGPGTEEPVMKRADCAVRYRD
jgi:acetoin utilization protein AcuB